MKSQTSTKVLLPLLLVFMPSTTELTGMTKPDMGVFFHEDPSALHCGTLFQQDGDIPRSELNQQQPVRRTESQRRIARLNAVKMWKLAEYLDLSREQADELSTRTREYQKSRDDIVKQRRQLYEEFQSKIRNNEIKPEDVTQYITETARLEKTLIDLRTKYVQNMEDILSDEQQAKLAVFEEYFRRQLEQGLRRD